MKELTCTSFCSECLTPSIAVSTSAVSGCVHKWTVNCSKNRKWSDSCPFCPGALVTTIAQRYYRHSKRCHAAPARNVAFWCPMETGSAREHQAHKSHWAEKDRIEYPRRRSSFRAAFEKCVESTEYQLKMSHRLRLTYGGRS